MLTGCEIAAPSTDTETVLPQAFERHGDCAAAGVRKRARGHCGGSRAARKVLDHVA